jgi:hypothetical protein
MKVLEYVKETVKSSNRRIDYNISKPDTATEL